MSEESIGNVPEFSRKPLYPEQEPENKGKILVTLEKYEALVLLIEALFNTINDRSPLGVVGNEFLVKLAEIKKEINEAKT